MIANYHTHTWRCNHASGSEREYVENAVHSGLRILGFSDHGPYIFPGDYYSNFRMKIDQVSGYVDTVLDLRKEFADSVQIPLGLELEFYPGLFRDTISFLRDFPFDYLIQGQHFVDDEFDAPYSGLITHDDTLLRKYVNQSIDGMQTGLFTYFAHPDLLNYQGDSKTYCREMVRICREAKSCGLPLEYNLLGQATFRNYPNVDFWRLAAEEGCQVIMGMDAHNPKALADLTQWEKGLSFLASLGITPIETVELRSII